MKNAVILVILWLPGCTYFNCRPGLSPLLISTADSERPIKLDGFSIDLNCQEQ